jgi:hypothetical protein
MTLAHSMRLSGGLALVMAVAVGCEDWTRLPDEQTTAAPTQGTTAQAATAQATTNAAAATATAAASAPAPSGSLGVTGAGGGFLWKPVAESNGKLVVLLPSQYTGSISTCFIASPSGSVIEQGSYGGVHNGGRVHFRFSQSGSYYGSGIYVVADLEDGTTVNWYIPDGGSRTEY